MRRSYTGFRPAPPRRGRVRLLKVAVAPPPPRVDLVDLWPMRGGRSTMADPLHGRTHPRWWMRKASAWSSTSGARRLEGIPRRHKARWPVPADLVGRCFNCLAFDHVTARCSRPSRCLRCEETGHVAKNCKRPRCPGPPLRGRGRPIRRAGLVADAAVAANSRGVGRSAGSASTASVDSASTGRAYSGPPSICAASPEDPRSPPVRHGSPPVFEPELPRGHPSRRP